MSPNLLPKAGYICILLIVYDFCGPFLRSFFSFGTSLRLDQFDLSYLIFQTNLAIELFYFKYIFVIWNITYIIYIHIHKIYIYIYNKYIIYLYI